VVPPAGPAAFTRTIQADQVETALAFLEHCRKAPRARVSSYTLKHTVERWGSSVGASAYVTNGAMVAAAIYAGFVVRPVGGEGNPNARIGINASDVARLAEYALAYRAARRGTAA